MSFISNIFRKKSSDTSKESNKEIVEEQVNEPVVCQLSEHDIKLALCRAWNELDASIVEPYLAEDLEYRSTFVSIPMQSKSEYMEYLKGKFNTIANAEGANIKADIITSNEGNEYIHLFQEKDIHSILDIRVKDGLIFSMLMRPMYDRFSFEKYEEDFQTLLEIAGTNLNHYFNGLPLKSPEDWAWIQTCPPSITFQHLCIAYKQYVLCIIVGLFQEDNNGTGKMYVPEQLHQNLLNECKKNGMTPCIFLINASAGVPLLPPCYLLDARTMEPLSLDSLSDDNHGLMSEWEINNCGITCACNYLESIGCKNVNYCDVLGITPQIWFEKEGQRCYALVRSLPRGLRSSVYSVNQQSLDRAKDYKGYFINLEFCSAVGNNGDFMDKILPRRSPLVHNKIELIELEEALKSFDFIEIDKGEYYQINN